MIKAHRTNYNDYLAYLYGSSAAYRNVTFQVTSECNLRCDYCYEHHKENKMMTPETGKKIVDLIIDAWEKNDPKAVINKSVKGIEMLFIGGEPFLNVKTMDAVCEYFLTQCAIRKCDLSKGLQIAITTNGVNYFDDDVQAFIKKYRPFINMTVSVDGTKELHDLHRKNLNGDGSFDKAYKAFRALSDMTGSVNTKMTFVPESFKYLYDSVLFMINEGATGINANCAYEPVYTVEDARELYSQLKRVSDYIIDNKLDAHVSMLNHSIGNPVNLNDNRNFCGGTGAMLSFDTDGIAYPCLRYHPISVGEEKALPMRIGDFSGIYVSDHAKKLKSYLDTITLTTQSSDECISCPVATGCGWCSAYNYEANGDINKRVTNICWSHKARVLASCYYHNKRRVTLGDEWAKKINLSERDALQIVNRDEWAALKELEKQAYDC